MFPSCGAFARMDSAPSSDRPTCSKEGSMSEKSSPCPPYSSGIWGANRSRSFASSQNSRSSSFETVLPVARASRSRGRTRSSMNAWTLSATSRAFSESWYSMRGSPARPM